MIKQSHYRTPRTTGECKWNPHMAPIEKSFRPHRNQRLDRWIMVLGLLAMLGGLVLLSGCSEPMSNDQIITETKKCHDAGMNANFYRYSFSGPGTTHVVCEPPRR